MAIIKPFKAILPKKDMAKYVAALPYDVYSEEEARIEVEKEPFSFLNIDRAETQFEKGTNPYDKKVYEKARELLYKWIKDGVLEKNDEEKFYIYELKMGERTQSGIVALASIDDYENNIIKKHEKTREDKEIDRISHVDICNAQTGPIFLSYRKNKIIREIIEKNKKQEPLFDFISEDLIGHRVYEINNTIDINQIRNEFDKINSIYIADGHHRAASAVKVGLKRRNENPLYSLDEEFNYFLSVVFQEDELYIMPYNRVVKDLNGKTSEEFLKQIKDKFLLEKMESSFIPEKKGVMGLYLDKVWYRIEIKDEFKTDDPVLGLDVSVLQNFVLSDLLGIIDPRTDKRIDFIGGIRGSEELERRCNSDMKLAFLMYPTQMEELFNVSDKNELMPPKSTWFEPKLRSGLFIHELS